MSVSQSNLSNGEDASPQLLSQTQQHLAFTARRLWITPLGALIALAGFSFSWDTWLWPGLATSGWGIALGPAGVDLQIFRGSIPELFLTLWLAPLTALLLLGLGIARYWRFRPRWLRFWAVLLTGGSLAIIGVVLADGNHLSSTPWLTAGGLVLALCGLFARSLYRNPAVPAPDVASPRLSRRKLMLNLAGVVGVGGVSTWLGINLSLLEQRAQAFRFALFSSSQIAPNGRRSLAWSPNSESLAGGIGHNLQSWKVSPAFSQVMAYNGGFSCFEVAWSPDGRALAAISSDGLFKVWDAQTGINYPPIPRDVWYSSLAWSPDSSRLATVGDPGGSTSGQMLQIWDARTFHLLRTSASPFAHHLDSAEIAWSPDGRLLATIEAEGNSVYLPGVSFSLWDAETGQHLFTQEIHPAQGSLVDIAWSPDSRYLALALSPGALDIDDITAYPVVIWDVATRQALLSCWGHLGGSTNVTWSPDGKFLAAGGYDRTVQVWNATTGQRVFTYQGHSPQIVACVVWSPDGKLLASVDFAANILVWDAPQTQ